RAEKEGESAKAFVTAEVNAGNTTLIQPITYESSAEAAVLQQLVVSNNIEEVEKADIESYVNTEVADGIESDTALATDMAYDLVDRSAAAEEFESVVGVDVGADREDEIDQIKFNAQTELETRLYASAAGEGTVVAFNNFIEPI